MLNFKGKVVFITGSGDGIGAAAAKIFAEYGAKVVVTDINLKSAKATAAKIRRKGGEAEAFFCDVRSVPSIKDAVKFALQKYKKIDICISNAGGTHGSTHVGNIEDYSDEEFDTVVKLNLYGAFQVCREIIPLMKKRKSGNIVITASGAGRTTSRAEVGRIPYAAAKAGQLGLMRQLALENGPYNIRVNAVAPGLALTTDYIKGNWEGNSEEEKIRTMQKFPLGRLGTSEDVAAAIVFAASDDAGWMTGHCIDICGGAWMM